MPISKKRFANPADSDSGGCWYCGYGTLEGDTQRVKRLLGGIMVLILASLAWSAPKSPSRTRNRPTAAQAKRAAKKYTKKYTKKYATKKHGARNHPRPARAGKQRKAGKRKK